MNSLLLDSRTEGEPSLASQLHDCTRDLMEANNLIEIKAKHSVDEIKSIVDARCVKAETAKKEVDEKRKRQINDGADKVKGEATAVESQSSNLTSLKNESEAIRVDLHQSGRLKTDLADEVVDLTATRDLEKTICDQKKTVVDDYIDANEKAVALYQTHLGLTIGRTPAGDLSISFTRLDSRSPSRAFHLVLHLDATSKLYSFVSSTPEAASADLQRLVGDLNRTNDLKRFICRARRIFLSRV